MERALVTDPIIGGILNWLHVVSAIGWLGAAMVFGMILSPALTSMTPGGRGEFMLKIVPKYAKYVSLLIVSTLVFGAALALYMAYGGGSFYFSGQWGMSIMAGAGTALLVAILGLGIIIPSLRKIVKLVTQMQANPAASAPPELAKLQGRVRVGSIVGMVLLFLVVVFMVAAAWS